MYCISFKIWHRYAPRNKTRNATSFWIKVSTKNTPGSYHGDFWTRSSIDWALMFIVYYADNFFSGQQTVPRGLRLEKGCLNGYFVLTGWLILMYLFGHFKSWHFWPFKIFDIYFSGSGSALKERDQDSLSQILPSERSMGRRERRGLMKNSWVSKTDGANWLGIPTGPILKFGHWTLYMVIFFGFF